MVEGKCPVCGKSIPVDPQMDVAICPYCGNAYVTAKALQGQSAAPSPNSFEALVAKCAKFRDAEMYHDAHETARMATRLFPDDYRSWSLCIDVYSADPNWSGPYPPEYVERAAKLYRVSNVQNPNFDQWLANYNLWMQQMQRVVDLCNKLDVERALSILGCVYLIKGGSSNTKTTYDDLKRRHHGGPHPSDTWIESARFSLVPGNGLMLGLTIGDRDTRFSGWPKSFTDVFYAVVTSGNVLDTLPALERAAGR